MIANAPAASAAMRSTAACARGMAIMSQAPRAQAARRIGVPSRPVYCHSRAAPRAQANPTIAGIAP